MAGLKLIFFTATIAVLIHLDPVHGVCSGPGLIPNPCVVGGGFCRLFPQAVCNVVDCEARYFVGKTDVTNHCEIDYCEDIECNGLCGIDPFTDQIYCDPSCDIDNGGCTADEVCVPRVIYCIRAPCPQPIECLPRTVLCNLQPDTDSCGLQSRQYFYNATSQRCERFIHGGCDRRGSDNRFDRLRDCQGTCNGVVDVCATISCPAGTRCTIDINSGTPYCDPSCEYENGGCSDDEICKMRPVYCITTPCPEFVECLPRKEICSLEPSVGDCRRAIPSYFYNYTSMRCDKFSYGGCGGNDNRFSLLEDCRETCEWPLRDPCSLIDCAPGTFCVVDRITGRPECVVDEQCLWIKCPPGTVCRINLLGLAECVPTTHHPCAAILCLQPDICRVDIETQTGYCGIDPCTFTRCASGYECQYNEETDNSVCVPLNDPCSEVVCKGGNVCRVNDLGVAECVFDERCLPIHCSPGSHCEFNEKTGQAECIGNDEHPCDTIQCPFFQICRVDQETQKGYCGFNPCFFTLCAFGFTCHYNEETDSALCLEDTPLNPCAFTLCSPGTMCQVNADTGNAECVRDPCAYLLCQAGLQCQVNDSGDAECVFQL